MYELRDEQSPTFSWLQSKAIGNSVFQEGGKEYESA